MFWTRRPAPRLILIAVLAVASITGIGDLALPDEHFMFEGGTSAQSHSHDSPGVLADGSVPSPDAHPEHTCHCVHAHGLALAALTEPFRVQVPVRSVVIEVAGSVVHPAAAPPFHPPKTLS